MDHYTPQQTIELIARAGGKKATMPPLKLFLSAFMVGPYLGFGCAMILTVNNSPWFQANAPGLLRMLSALVSLPVSLTMILVSGSDMFTTNLMYMTTALLARRCRPSQFLINLAISFLGNLAGTLFSVALIFGYGGVFDAGTYRTTVLSFATNKVVVPAWHQIFLRGIGANWLVCFAVFAATQGRELVSKIVGLWGPVVLFVGLGLDHAIANMFFIPMAIFLGSPDITVAFYIWKSLIPTLLGNWIGGGIFVGVVYWYIYLYDEAPATFDTTAKIDTGNVSQSTTAPGRHPSQETETATNRQGPVFSITEKIKGRDVEVGV